MDRIVKLPEDQYMPTLVALIGPPSIKQPLVLDQDVVTVIEKRPLESGPSGAVGA